MSHKPILHLIFDDKFIDRAIDQFEQALPGQHNYLLDKASSDHKIKYIKKNLDKINMALRGSKDYFDQLEALKPELVVLHSLSYYFAHVVNTALAGKKIIWIFWGGEVYDFMKEFRNDNFKAKTKSIATRYVMRNNLRNWLRPTFFKIKNPKTNWNFSKYQAFSKIDGFALAHQNEFEILKEQLGLTCQLHWFTYYSIEHLISKELQHTSVNGQNILIGNSATPSNNHLDILHQIKTEVSIGNRQLIVPLSYGEGWYKDKIKAKGLELFPDNFKALVDFMPLAAYNKIVFSCNIVIMNHLRQQAVGNLIVSFWIGAKVFLDEQNPLFDYFKSIGLIVFSIQKDLQLIAQNDALKDTDIQNQRSILMQHYNEANVIEQTRSMLAHHLEKTEA